MPTPDHEALSWLREFEAACRGRNFDAGRWLCVHSHVSLQPTQSESAHGRVAG